MKVKIFQIFYNEATRLSLDPGFLPLDNISNPRPDWREYWPIRNFILNNKLYDDYLYGFFSPKFFKKTSLSSKDCLEFVKQNIKYGYDIFAFSPYFDLTAYFQNCFFHCLAKHSNSKIAVIESLKILGPNLNIDDIVNHSGNNIFSNFFIAKPNFWKEWIYKSELIFNEAEKKTKVGLELNKIAFGHSSEAPIKTFIIERIASMILATNNSYKTLFYNPFKLPFSAAKISKEKNILIQMDSLKKSYLQNTELSEYLHLFKIIQSHFPW